MEPVVDKAKKALSALDRLAGERSEKKAINSKEDFLAAAEAVGQSNATALRDGEYAEFFTADQYSDNYETHCQVRTNKTSGRDSLYVLARIYRKVGDREVGENYRFINPVGLIRYHYESETNPKESGMKLDAQSVLSTGTLNESLRNEQTGWNIISNVLSGKTIKCKKTTEKRLYAHWEGGKRAENMYDFTFGLEYSLA